MNLVDLVKISNSAFYLLNKDDCFSDCIAGGADCNFIKSFGLLENSLGVSEVSVDSASLRDFDFVFFGCFFRFRNLLISVHKLNNAG